MHPLAAAFGTAWVSRMIGLLIFNFGTDAAGQQLQVSPLNSLMLAVPYYTCWSLLAAAAFFAAWRLLPHARSAVTALGVATSLALILLTQVDFGMQRFRGERLSLVHLRTYLTPNLINGDWLGPVTEDPKYFATTLAVWIGASLTILWTQACAASAIGPTA